MRLSRAALGGLPADILRPGYDPATVTAGIVHFGPGAFHRAHQGAFVDALLHGDARWGIVEASLRSGSVTGALAEQDGLYTLDIRDADPEMRVIGAVVAVIGPDELARLTACLDDPAIRLVTSTVTEKGYCLAADATLDFTHPDIVHDLAHPDAPSSLVGWLALGLRRRRASGVAPFSVVPCDNLPDNGGRVRDAVVAFAQRIDPTLADWIAGEVKFASTMVDSITPASDAALLARVASAIGCEDRAAVQRERFSHWVIEDVLPGDGPDLRGVGVQLTSDVAGFERAKLRILNGAHSSLAYLGLLRGHESVADAMRDEQLAGFIQRLIADIVPGLMAPRGLDVPAYVAAVLTRFHNPAVHHRLAQIAADGSKKLPYRLLDSVAEARGQGRPVDRLLLPIAAWLRCIARAESPAEVSDPLAAELIAATRDEAQAIDRLLALRTIVPDALAADAEVVAALRKGWRATSNADSLTSAICL